MNRAEWMTRAIRRAPGGASPVQEGAAHGWGERVRALLPVLAAAVIFGVLAAIGAGYVTLKLKELELGRALSEAHEARSALTTQGRELDAQLGTLERADRILPAARDKLKLLPPDPTQLGGPPP